MNFCRSGVVCFMHPKHVLRDEPVVHYGEAPRAAASFNHALQRTAPRVTVAAISSSNPSRPSHFFL